MTDEEKILMMELRLALSRFPQVVINTMMVLNELPKKVCESIYRGIIAGSCAHELLKLELVQKQDLLMSLLKNYRRQFGYAIGASYEFCEEK